MRCGIGGVLGLGQQGGALAVGHQHGLEQALRPGRGLLRHHADAGAGGERDVAGIGVQLAGDQLQQRGLAGAVAADQPGMVAGRQRQAGALQQQPPADAVGQVLDRQHGAPIARRLGRGKGKQFRRAGGPPGGAASRVGEGGSLG